MDSAASRIVKARQYALERDRRVTVHSFEVELHGENSNHLVSYDRGDWRCDCEEFSLQGVCAHSIALERILGDTVQPAVMPIPTRMDAAASRLVKARQYAEERDHRIRVHSCEVELRGEHSNHIITYDDAVWECDCEEFVLRGVCPHVMAMEEILGASVEPALPAVTLAA
ncbi:MAG TPA: SWIM zinc finger family protein [Caldilineaceae bacterium]|nr:SWIM zinc finger family protein [Caldilineaceae bacterium]